MSPVRTLTDPVLATLLGLLAATLTAFLLDVFPYPFGLFILVALIAGRFLYLQDMKGSGR